MTLTTHAIVGSLIGAVAYHNIPFAVVAAVLSHPLMDAIPHWDYELGAGNFENADPMQNDIDTSSRQFYWDLAKIGFDFFLGLIIVVLIFWHTPHIIFGTALLCALSAIAPDPLQFVYWKTRSRLLEPWQRFHMYMHAKTKLHAQPFLGIVSQTAIIMMTLALISRVI